MQDDKSTKIILAIFGFLVAIVATIGGFTLVASLANVSPILGLILAIGIVAVDSAIFHFISFYLK